MNDASPPESDRAEGAPHPRETLRLFGHEDAVAEILASLGNDRMHHAWLLAGPRGVGKATLAWAVARILLARTGAAGKSGSAPKGLDMSADHPVARRVAALSDPGCLLIRRAWDADRKRLKNWITVDEIRRVNRFLGLTAADGGCRVVIVDAADDMNLSAANALLKLLEEPPGSTVLILVSHQPARLLPTIRSRCRIMRLRELDETEMDLALSEAGIAAASANGLHALANGSVGEAVRLVHEGGLELYGEIMDVIATAPSMDRAKLLKLAERVSARGAERRFDLAARLLDRALARLARTAAGMPPESDVTPGESETLARLGANMGRAHAWAELQQELSARLTHGREVNIDPASLIMDAFLRIEATAAL
ncbi:MAG: DNA polymerase III subunit delta' [Boseongicola sp.]|nr:DNA polymerase III subunit delta' [Boseongicola sp.]